MSNICSYNIEEKELNSILLDGNESPLNYDLTRIAFIVSRIKDEDLNRYPDSDANKLREVYSKFLGVEKDNLIVGNGSDEMINIIISKYIEKGKKLYTLCPDFSMYDFYNSVNQGEIVKFNTLSDGKFNVYEFVENGLEENVSLIILSNPNNPTGNMISLEQIQFILDKFKEIPVVIDEAYIEFSGGSCINLIDKYSNLIVTRTLSKAWGLASIRVGFLVSNKEKVKELYKYKVPYNVSAISQLIACNVLENENIDININKIMNWKEEFFEDLKAIERDSSINIKFYKGYANFIYGRCEYKESLLEEFKRKHIKIRDFNDNTFRITVGVPMQNKLVVEAVRKACIYEEEF